MINILKRWSQTAEPVAFSPPPAPKPTARPPRPAEGAGVLPDGPLTGADDRAALLALAEAEGLFDAAWYAARYPAAAGYPGGPGAHFRDHGIDQGLDPAALFSTEHYRATQPAVRRTGQHPLAHYLKAGRRAGQTHPHIAPHWLAAQPALRGHGKRTLLGAYAALAEPLPPRPLFDLAHLVPRLGLPPTASGWEILRAYHLLDAAARPRPHLLFDPAWVALCHPEAATDPIGHYLTVLGRGIDPHGLIQAAALDRHLDCGRLEGAGLSRLEGFFTHAKARTIETHPLFDAAHYTRAVEEAGGATALPLQHYLAGGWRAGFRANPWFDCQGYAARHDLKAGEGLSPLEHYARHGHEPWIDALPGFEQRRYLARHADAARDHRTPLQHFMEVGQKAGERAVSAPLWFDPDGGWDALEDEILAAPLSSDAPVVSVIVPVHNQYTHTLRCLYAIARAGDRTPLEVIVIDDASCDQTATALPRAKGIRLIRQDANAGFLASCNRAAAAARGQYLYFLNNDTAVLPGWIDRLVESFERLPEAGIIGSQLIYPSGRLQEAGGVIFRDGTGANIGRDSDRDAPAFSRLRDVTYVSGAGLMLRRALWQRMDGFDPAYAPAYCEDSDLALRVAEAGWRVLVQPASRVIHFEGVSHGTSVKRGVKAHQITNQARLRDRHAFALEAAPEPVIIDPSNVPGPRRPRVLIIDALLPKPDHDAGSVTLVAFIEILLAAGYDVTFLPDNLTPDRPTAAPLRARGVEVLEQPYVPSVAWYLDRWSGAFDAFLLYRATVGAKYIDGLKAKHPEKPVIFDTVDLHFLRLEREATLTGSERLTAEAASMKRVECAAIARADATILLSSAEEAVLAAEGLAEKTKTIPLVLHAEPARQTPMGRSGIAFIGGCRHPPNVAAVRHFLADIWPSLRAAEPALTFHIVGPDAPADWRTGMAEGVVVEGHVPDLSAYLTKRLATVAPLTFGAGVKGKIGSSMAAGVPVLATAVAVEGMALTPGADYLPVASAEDYITALRRLRGEAGVWQQLSDAGRRLVAARYAPDVVGAALLDLFQSVGAAPFFGRCPITGQPEHRRRDPKDPTSLAGPNGVSSPERVLALALANHLGAADRPLVQHAPGAVPPITTLGAFAKLSTLWPAALPHTAEVLLAALPGDKGAGAVLAEQLSKLPRLTYAAIALNRDPDGTTGPSEGIAACALALKTAGFAVRTARTPTPDAAITGTTLVEGRRGGRETRPD